MNREFKIGDLVILNFEKILKYKGHIPDWYTTETYEIIDMTHDCAYLEPEFPNPLKNFNTITPEFLKLSIITERKEKLQKLNES
jgi:hypothetical protein